MSEHIVNALTGMKKVYLDQVSHMNLERMYLEEETRQIEEFKKPELDPVGKEDGDIDNDGDRDNSDSYLKNRRNVITGEIEKEILAAMKKLKSGNTSNSNESADNVERNLMAIKGIKPQVKESAYYNWRDTVEESLLWEIIDDVDQKQVKEKNVNNYVGKNPVVEINPEIKTESILIDTDELDEDFIQESIDIVTDYLFDEGLTYEDIEDLITELGVDEFYEWVVEFGYETLYEARAGAVKIEPVTAKGEQFKKTKSNPQGIPQGKSLERLRKLKAERKAKEEKASQEKPSGMTAALRSQASVANKKETPAPKKGFFASAIERDRASRQKAGDLIKQTVQTAQKAGQAASRFGSSVREPFETTKAGRNLQAALIKGLRTGSRAVRDAAAKEVARRRVGVKEEFESWVDNLLDEGYDLSEYTWDELYEEYEYLYEKAVSEQQQKLFGLALSVKRGETPRSEVSEEVLKIVDTVSEKEIRKYAGTSHEGIPKSK